MNHRCGCENAVDPASGVLRRVRTCPAHQRQQRDPATLDEAYYRELGTLDADAPARYVGELTEALGELPEAKPGGVALEIGCGASPYIGAIQAAGYNYLGVDPSEWACEWIRREFGAGARCATIEDSWLDLPIHGIVLAAHVFEHLADAPGAIAKAARLLAPGGELWLIVPDDSDPLNPDHLWFFTETTLKRALESAGLTVERFAVRRRVKHENFLYARARKPT